MFEYCQFGIYMTIIFWYEDPSDFQTIMCVRVYARVLCYRFYFECVHIEITDNIDFYSESAVYINYKVNGGHRAHISPFKTPQHRINLKKHVPNHETLFLVNIREVASKMAHLTI